MRVRKIEVEVRLPGGGVVRLWALLPPEVSLADVQWAHDKAVEVIEFAAQSRAS